MSRPSYEKIPRVWAGERVFIVGGGPSAMTVDWECLRGKFVLACNAAAFLMPVGIAQYAVFGDKPFLRTFRAQLRHYVNLGGVLINATGRPTEEQNHWMLHVQRLNGRKHWGISEDPAYVRWNRTTGGCAINVAYLMGAAEIILIGYDMHTNGKRHNWHEAYEPFYKENSIVQPALKAYQTHFIHAFEPVSKDLARLRVKCFNASPGSSITTFPIVKLEDFL